uniref:Lactamase_B domain-containing protein n=1 Tax=Steinernema glaseri TaxID=37863 RepID=A0A1I7ZRA6_9BILA
MRCTPPAQGDTDPCRDLANGKDAVCQKDFGGEFICCGTTDLLLELLSPDQRAPTFRRVELPPSLLERAGPPPLLRVLSGTTGPSYLYASNSRSSLTRPESWNNNIGAGRTLHDPVPPLLPVPSEAYNSDFTNAVDTSSPGILSAAPIMENGPTVTLLTTGRLLQGRDQYSYSARSTVVMVQDGDCRIIVNTGLPSQAEELKSSLSSKGLSESLFDFLVVTSSSPQLVGNLNLFKSRKTLMGFYEVQDDTVATTPLDTAKIVDLCSPRSQLVSTPGASPDGTTVLLKDVPAMGTVAITGTVFLEDDDLSRTDPLFTSNRDQLLATRRRLICEADWLIPAHSGPIPVSAQSRRTAGC